MVASHMTILNRSEYIYSEQHNFDMLKFVYDIGSILEGVIDFKCFWI